MEFSESLELNMNGSAQTMFGFDSGVRTSQPEQLFLLSALSVRWSDVAIERRIAFDARAQPT